MQAVLRILAVKLTESNDGVEGVLEVRSLVLLLMSNEYLSASASACSPSCPRAVLA